ncbi:hypothetical protein PIB30_067122, partial [Stylosanthes scabra]|nr:hypothetical protein [Stylosanthes scabra]
MEAEDNRVNSDALSKEVNDDTVNTEKEWIPECEDELKGKVGMLFDTFEEGGEFYKRYAHAAGFSIRNSTKTKDKQGVQW